jgi:hypothetical protein
MKSSLIFFLWPSPGIILPEEQLPGICRTDLIQVFFNYIVAVAPYWKKRKFPYWEKSKFFPDLRKIRKGICDCLSNSEKTHKPPNLSPFGNDLIQFAKVYGFIYSDFGWKVESLVKEVLLHKDFVTTNRMIYHMLGPPPIDKKINLAKNFAKLLNLFHLKRDVASIAFDDEDEIIEPDSSFSNHHFLNYLAFLSNIMVHQPSAPYYWYAGSHDYIAGNFDESNLVQKIPEPSEKLDPNEAPVDIFVHIFNYFIILLFVVCVGYNIYWHLL